MKIRTLNIVHAAIRMLMIWEYSVMVKGTQGNWNDVHSSIIKACGIKGVGSFNHMLTLVTSQTVQKLCS